MSNDKDPDRWQITGAQLDRVGSSEDGSVYGFAVSWQTKGAGFGEFAVSCNRETGELSCDNETMPRQFVREVFAVLVDSMKLKDS